MKTDVTYAAADGRAMSTSIEVVDADPVRTDLPLVVLLHGNNGTVEDMSEPDAHPATNYDWSSQLPLVIDRGWHSYPNAGVWSIGLDTKLPVTGWQPALLSRGFSTLNYQQTEPSGLLANAVIELRAILNVLDRNRVLAIVAHSRGGLLIRQLLAEDRDENLTARIAMVVTLHSPHQGSGLANVATELTTELNTLRLTEPATIPLTDWLLSQVNAPSYQQFRIGSDFLEQLESRESVRPPPMPFHTFGGTNSVLSRTNAWIFSPDSAVPQLNPTVTPPTVGFHWITARAPGPTLFTALPPISVELIDGLGDVLVSEISTRLPFESSHTVHHLNHGEVLWNTTVQEQVATLLATVGGRRAPISPAVVMMDYRPSASLPMPAGCGPLAALTSVW